MKKVIKSAIIKGLNSLHVSSKFIGTPKGAITTANWCHLNNASYNTLYNSKTILEPPPNTIEGKVSTLFKAAFKREQPEVFVATIPNGRVWGRNGTVITQDDQVLYDVSREFGAYKGIMGERHSVFNQFKLQKPSQIKGTVAVISTSGCNNYYHWMIDVLPRIQLLKLAGLFKAIDYFIIDYNGLPFQTESLKKVEIDLHRIIKSNDQWKFHIEAEWLVVPALPSVLSTVNDWQVDFLRNLFLHGNVSEKVQSKSIFISRKKAVNRKLINEDEIISYLKNQGYEVFYPEDYTIEEFAQIMYQAKNVISVHGAGNTNWVFCQPESKLTELFLSTQVYPNFWLLANRIGANYTYITSDDGEFHADIDLVVNKKNDDFEIKLYKIEKLNKS